MKSFHFLILGLLFFLSACQPTKLIQKASSGSDLQKLINQAEEGAIIKLEQKVYKIDELIYIRNKKKLTIEGNGASLILNSLTTDVIEIRNSENIILKNFMAKHFEPSGPTGCTGNVISIDESKNIQIEGCELNGSGIVGIASYHSENLIFKNNHIHNNSKYPIISQNASVIIEGNTFENNGNNVIYFEHVPQGESASWPPSDQLSEDKNMEGLIMKNNKFKK
jgi:parallel beta-helix repeat protein